MMGNQRQEIIAAVSATIAEETGTDVSGFRILSFKKSTVSSHQEVAAAVAATIAEEIGTDISGVRILSFRQI